MKADIIIIQLQRFHTCLNGPTEIYFKFQFILKLQAALNSPSHPHTTQGLIHPRQICIILLLRWYELRLWERASCNNKAIQSRVGKSMITQSKQIISLFSLQHLCVSICAMPQGQTLCMHVLFNQHCLLPVFCFTGTQHTHKHICCMFYDSKVSAYIFLNISTMFCV